MCGLEAPGLALSATGINYQNRVRIRVATYTFPSKVRIRLSILRTTQAWLFVRGPESVRIVSDGESVAVYGPGARFSQSRFREELDAALHQASVEHELVRNGWSLEQLTTERRSSAATPFHPERRAHLRLVT